MDNFGAKWRVWRPYFGEAGGSAGGGPWAGRSGGRDENSDAFAGPRPGADDDFDVAIERVEEVHEALNGKAIETVVRQRGDLGLVDSQASLARAPAHWLWGATTR